MIVRTKTWYAHYRWIPMSLKDIMAMGATLGVSSRGSGKV